MAVLRLGRGSSRHQVAELAEHVEQARVEAVESIAGQVAEESAGQRAVVGNEALRGAAPALSECDQRCAAVGRVGLTSYEPGRYQRVHESSDAARRDVQVRGQGGLSARAVPLL
jgi:hypothetical protein